MKNILMVLVCVFSLVAHAESDFERGMDFYSNAMSGGTYLPKLEAETAQIQADYEKKTEEWKLQLEKDHQENLKKILIDEIAGDQIMLQKFEDQIKPLKEQIDSFEFYYTMARALSANVITLDRAEQSLQEKLKNDPNGQAEWNFLLSQVNPKNADRPLDPDTIEKAADGLMDLEEGLRDEYFKIHDQIQEIQSSMEAAQKQLDLLK